MYKSINQYHVVLALQQQWWENPDFLKIIYVQTPKGTDVPLSAFTHFTQGLTPIRLPHQGQFPATTFSFNLAENVPLSDAVVAIDRAEVDLGLPANITGRFAGTARAYQQALSNQPVLIGTALLAVYIVLGILYESLIHPLTIISTLPSAGVGALVAMVLFKSNLDIVGMIGIILLIGIVKKNAIMMIDFALAERYLPGLPAALPSHHDDDDVRAAGWDADGARLGRRSGIAEAPRHRHCWRPAGQPDVDVVHHPGDLSLS
jgi:multidrug efflux pump